jgi:uncharacterized protein YfbU (UPF0304 family)
MQLTRTERLLLVNQCRIMEALFPAEAKSLGEIREALERGYVVNYADAFRGIDTDEVSESECREVIHILDMFRVLKASYDKLEDKSGIDAEAIRFGGFDGNQEPSHHAFASYRLERGHWAELLEGRETNSHAPMLPEYRKMLAVWIGRDRETALSKGDIVAIVAARSQ